MSVPPRVTILMPVYNGLPHLPQAIESALSQTLPDFEFLIIHDGSTGGPSGTFADRKSARSFSAFQWEQ